MAQIYLYREGNSDSYNEMVRCFTDKKTAENLLRMRVEVFFGQSFEELRKDFRDPDIIEPRNVSIDDGDIHRYWTITELTLEKKKKKKS